jgi:hypothetical protein
MTVFDFLSDRSGKDTLWWIDPDTREIATRCTTCEAESRHSVEELMDFRFRHAVWCPVGLRTAPGEA